MSKKKIVILLILLAVIGIIVMQIIRSNNEKQRNYDLEKVSQYNYFVLRIGDKYGVIDVKGNTIIDAEYDSVKIPNPTKDLFVCYENDKTEILNANKEKKFTEYEKIEPIKLKNVINDLVYEKSVLIYKQDEKYGLIDFEGNKITEAIYDSIDGVSYREGELLVGQNNKLGVINIKGKKIVDIKYDEVKGDNYYSEETGYKLSGYIVGIKEETGMLYGYINPKGKLILKIKYNNINRIIDIKEDKDSYLIVAQNGQYGVYKNKKKIINCEYQNIEYDSNNNMFILEKSKQYGVANIDGKVIIPVENSNIEVKGIYIYAKSNDENKVYNSNGEKIDKDFNKTIMKINNENYYITIKSENGNYYYGIMDKNNNQLVQEEYLYIEYLYGDYFIASNKEGKLGIINNKGEEIVELKYDLVQKIQEKNVIQTAINETGITEIYNDNLEKSYSMANANIISNENYIKMYSNTDLKYFDNNGNEIKNIDLFQNNTLFSKENQDKKWGFVNKAGEIKVEQNYERVTDFNEYGFAGIKQDSKWGVVNEEGDIILEPTYDFENFYSDPEFIGKYYKVQVSLGEIYYTDKI